MGKAACTFKLNDFKRLVQAAAKAGLEIGTIRVSKAGDLELTPKSATPPRQEEGNDWDDLRSPA